MNLWAVLLCVFERFVYQSESSHTDCAASFA